MYLYRTCTTSLTWRLSNIFRMLVVCELLLQTSLVLFAKWKQITKEAFSTQQSAVCLNYLNEVLGFHIIVSHSWSSAVKFLSLCNASWQLQYWTHWQEPTHKVAAWYAFTQFKIIIDAPVNLFILGTVFHLVVQSMLHSDGTYSNTVHKYKHCHRAWDI